MKITGKIADNTLIDPSPRHLTPRIWIVVADQRTARIFRNVGQDLESIGEAFPTQIQRKIGLSDNSMGRIISFGGAHHKLAPHAQPVGVDAINFAHDLSLWLENAAHNGLFDRLILVAAPKTLGNLRKMLGKSVLARITAEVNKELTKLSEKNLQEELKEIVWF